MSKSAIILPAMLCVLSVRAADQMALARLFGDGAVLQRGKEVPVWGWTAPNTKVCGRIAGIEVWEGVGNDGKFTLRFPSQKAGGPYELVVSNAVTGATAISRDIMIGEVWLASGQSNMQMPVESWRAARINQDDINNASIYADVRLLQISRATGMVEHDYFSADFDKWKESSPETVRNFSAAGWYFGRKLYE